MQTLRRTLLESAAVFAVGFAIIASMLYAFSQNSAMLGA
jgi:hypothetical protein